MSPFLAPAGPHFGPPTYAGQYAAAAAMAAAAAAAATQQHPHAHLRHPQPAQTANKTPNGPPSSQGRDSERTPEGSSALMAPPGKQQEPAASSPVQTSPSTGGRPDADQLAAFYGLSPAVLAAAASATAALLGGAQPAPNSLGLVPATTSVSSPNHSATHQSNGQSRASPKEQTKANGIAVHESKHKSSDAPGAAGEAIDRCDKKRLLNGSSKGDQTFEGPDGTRESKRLRSEGDKQADDGRPSEPERQQTNCDSQSSDCNGLDAGTDTDAGHLEDSKEASKVQVECKSSNNHVDSNGQSKGECLGQCVCALPASSRRLLIVSAHSKQTNKQTTTDLFRATKAAWVAGGAQAGDLPRVLAQFVQEIPVRVPLCPSAAAFN